jgi:signal transduction histidine kinase/HAMP domain-containing protein
MKLSLRYRIVFTLVPLLALLALLGTAGAVLLHRLGGSIDLILRENYDSVIAMERLNEALERIDSSFQFALAGREAQAREQFKQNQKPYDDALELEQNNITLHGEQELVDELVGFTDSYRREGRAFYALPAGDVQRNSAYFGPIGLLARFGQIKKVSNDILRLNQENMEEANLAAKQTARNSLIGFGIGIAVAAALAALLAWRTINDIVQPVRVVTDSALAISRGNLDQVISVASRDELGELAEAFNLMARQIRYYRQTDYARLLRAQRTSQATIDSFPDPVLVVDPEARVELANPAAQLLFGVGSKKDQPGDVWQPPPALREPLHEALRQQRPFSPEGFDHAVSFNINAQPHYYLPRILPIRDPYGNTLGAAVLLADVTRYRLLDQVKGDLVATVSHELKTPLTTVRLALHLLLEETIGPLTPKQTELLLDARDNAERLVSMVNNMLDLTRLEEGRFHLVLQPQSPRELLTNAADAVLPRAEAKEISVRVEAPDDLPPIKADAQQIGHALGNLLDNALTYTEPGGQVTLAASAVDGRVALTVSDTGCGIPAEHAPHVFERFFRIPGQSKGSGTGLGLAIVREIILAHGGTVVCHSTPGTKTTFQIELPAYRGDK